MISMCFDLSSSCIGTIFAQTKGEKITSLHRLAIIPKRPTGVDLGYTTKKQKTIDSNGKSFKGFLKPGEYAISQAEAKRRNAEFKVLEHRYLLNDIGKQVGYYLGKVKPDIIAIERNKAFNGILTTKLLAEIAGGLFFYAGAMKTTFYDVDEATVRARIRKDLPLNRNQVELAVDTKYEIYSRLRDYFTHEHPHLELDFEKMTMDESDALAVFYYLYQTKLRNG